jgi:hypothetical protein
MYERSFCVKKSVTEEKNYKERSLTNPIYQKLRQYTKCRNKEKQEENILCIPEVLENPLEIKMFCLTFFLLLQYDYAPQQTFRNG